MNPVTKLKFIAAFLLVITAGNVWEVSRDCHHPLTIISLITGCYALGWVTPILRKQ